MHKNIGEPYHKENIMDKMGASLFLIRNPLSSISQRNQHTHYDEHIYLF